MVTANIFALGGKYRAHASSLVVQNHLGQVQAKIIHMLSDKGRALVSAVVADRHVYGPGAVCLKDITTNYVSLTGAHKALLGSIQLIVFRQVLASVDAMVS